MNKRFYYLFWNWSEAIMKTCDCSLDSPTSNKCAKMIFCLRSTQFNTYSVKLWNGVGEKGGGRGAASVNMLSRDGLGYFIDFGHFKLYWQGMLCAFWSTMKFSGLSLLLLISCDSHVSLLIKPEKITAVISAVYCSFAQFLVLQAVLGWSGLSKIKFRVLVTLWDRVEHITHVGRNLSMPHTPSQIFVKYPRILLILCPI